MADLKIRRLWGRVDFLYDRRASEIVDRRGEIARAAVEFDGSFLQYALTDDGATVQSALSELQITSSFASCIWRDEHKRSGLLDFLEKQIGSTRKVKAIKFYSTYARTSVLTLDEMIESMKAGTNWDGFGLENRSELTDVAIVYTVSRGGTPFTVTCGPMGAEQLKNAVYGTMAVHAPPDSLPAPVWFLSLAENDWSPLPEGTTMRIARAAVGERFGVWGDFADEFLRGK